MNDWTDIFAAIRRAAVILDARSRSACPDLRGLEPSELPDELTIHIAFCPECRERLQVMHRGKRVADTSTEPNWNRMLRRLGRAARWILLTERIRGVTGIPDGLLPEMLPARVRLAGRETAGITLTIFEINLTELPELSTDGLEIEQFGETGGSGDSQLVIRGFRPELEGAPVRLGLARSTTCLDLCGVRTENREWDLSGIEHKLQKAFLRKGRPSRRLQRLIDTTAWLDGRISSGTGGPRLVLTPPAALTSLFLRDDIWTMLLVSDSPVNPERPPEKRF